MSVHHAAGGQFESFGNNIDDDSQSHENDEDNAFIIRIRGLPWSTTKQEICDFFNGVNILNGEDGIHLVTLATNNTKPLGEAYLELASSDDVDLAQSFHKKNLGTRYIEVFEASYDEFQSIMNKQKGIQDESVVRLRGLPWNANENDIADFFQGLQIKKNNGIHIPFNKNGKASGEAFVHFETVDDCNQALQRNMDKLGHRYIEIFRSTEQQLMSSLQQTMGRNNIGGRNSNNGNFQSNGNNRMHPYERNNGNNFGRGNNMRGRQQNMRNDFRKGQGDMFTQNSASLNNRSFGNRPFNNGNQTNFGNSNNFYDDFDLNELAKSVNNFDRPGSNNRNMNTRSDFPNNSNTGNNFAANWNMNRNDFKNQNSQNNQNNQNNQFGQRSGNFNNFGTNNRFKNDNSNRNFMSQDDDRSGQHCIHMRGLPYYTDEMDVFNFFGPLKPSFCKIIINKNGLHSGEAKAYFDSYDHVRTAMSKDRMKMGSRYIELFYGGSN